MEPMPSTQLITANGEYSIFTGVEGANVLIEIEGTLGGATVTLGRESIARVFRAYQENAAAVTLAPGDMKMITLGIRGTLALKVTGAGGTTSIQFGVSRYKPLYYS